MVCIISVSIWRVLYSIVATDSGQKKAQSALSSVSDSSSRCSDEDDKQGEAKDEEFASKSAVGAEAAARALYKSEMRRGGAASLQKREALMIETIHLIAHLRATRRTVCDDAILKNPRLPLQESGPVRPTELPTMSCPCDERRSHRLMHPLISSTRLSRESGRRQSYGNYIY